MMVPRFEHLEATRELRRPSPERDLAHALEAWAAALGGQYVVHERETLREHEANVTGFARTIRAVLRPASTEAVQDVVRIARRFRIPLYPISTGKNWGLGSKLPVESGAVLVDLGRMTRIAALDAEQLHATVEAGVTQRQLYEEIERRALPVRMNVTGSAADTSLVGNALERGIGYFGSRAEETSNLEVVLGTGEVLRTGFGHMNGSALAALYRHGIGPSLDGLFFQSNFGIVTAATIALRSRPEHHAAAVVSIDDEQHLPSLIDALARARREGAFEDVVHIGDRSRTRITMAPLVAAALERTSGLSTAEARGAAVGILDSARFGAWSALVAVAGSKARVAEALRIVRGHVRGVGRVKVLNDWRLDMARAILRLLRPFAAARRAEALLEAVTPLYGLTRGIPTDAAVASIGYAADAPAGTTAVGAGASVASPAPDPSDAGMLYCLPLMPLTGDAAAKARATLSTTAREHGIEPSVTFNILDDRVLEAVITIPFRRSDAQATERAHRCNDALRRRFLDCGFTPYRVDVNAMSDIVDGEDPFWRAAAELKDVFDPDGIISPRRYGLR